MAKSTKKLSESWPSENILSCGDLGDYEKQSDVIHFEDMLLEGLFEKHLRVWLARLQVGFTGESGTWRNMTFCLRMCGGSGQSEGQSQIVTESWRPFTVHF